MWCDFSTLKGHTRLSGCKLYKNEIIWSDNQAIFLLLVYYCVVKDNDVHTK